jgi:hypothetical protein
MTHLTENQQHFLKHAASRNGTWWPVAGVCLQGQMSGRGRGTVLKSLESKSLIEVRLRDVGVYRTRYVECIRITTTGKQLFNSLQKVCKRCGKPPEDPVQFGKRGSEVYCRRCTCHDCGEALEGYEETSCTKCMLQWESEHGRSK